MFFQYYVRSNLRCQWTLCIHSPELLTISEAFISTNAILRYVKLGSIPRQFILLCGYCLYYLKISVPCEGSAQSISGCPSPYYC